MMPGFPRPTVARPNSLSATLYGAGKKSRLLWNRRGKPAQTSSGLPRVPFGEDTAAILRTPTVTCGKSPGTLTSYPTSDSETRRCGVHHRSQDYLAEAGLLHASARDAVIASARVRSSAVVILRFSSEPAT